MEVRLDKRYPVAATLGQAWAVLSDVRATAACMPGAQITEQLDDTHFKGSVKCKVGPAQLVFNGDIELLGRDAAAHSLQMLGKGADRAGSSATMNLAARLEPGEDAASTVLVGRATIVVSGKLAQFGSRLLVPVSDALLAQFADNFRAAAAASVAPTAAAPAVAPAAVAPAAVATAAVATAAVATAAVAMAPAAMASAAGAARPAAAAAAAATPAAKKPQELDALALAWAVLAGWLRGLFGRKG